MPTHKQPDVPEISPTEEPQEPQKTSVEKQVPKAVEQVAHIPEVPVNVEQKTEKPVEKTEDAGFLDETIGVLKKKLKSQKKKPTQVPQIRDEATVEIERIMEQDLKEAYKELTPVQKQEFKMKGEEVALKIRHLIKSTHIRVKSIFKLILEWLRMLPGINKFFLEQEAKIKTDKILTISNKGKQK